MFFVVFLISLQVAIVSAMPGWTYVPTDDHCTASNENPCGPGYWGIVNHACDGHSQSPIDISNAQVGLEAAAPEFNIHGGGCNEWAQFSTLSHFEIHMEGCTNLSLTYHDHEYEMTQLHFHSPSEHSIGGGYYSSEVHMVHRYHSDYIILAVMLEVSATVSTSNNSFLDTLWSHGAGHTLRGEEVSAHDYSHPLNPYHAFLPASPLFYSYSGSFTVPPCTEGATWFVYDKAVKISDDDLKLMREAMASTTVSTGTTVTDEGNNNRPIQDRNDREITMYAGARGHIIHESVENPIYDEVEETTSTVTAFGAVSIALSCVLLLVTVCLCVQLRQQMGKAGPPAYAPLK